MGQHTDLKKHLPKRMDLLSGRCFYSLKLFSVNDLVASRSIGYHGDRNFQLFFDEFDVIPALLGQFVIFFDAPDLFLPAWHNFVHRFRFL